jgi:hypothetical protein
MSKRSVDDLSDLNRDFEQYYLRFDSKYRSPKYGNIVLEWLDPTHYIKEFFAYLGDIKKQTGTDFRSILNDTKNRIWVHILENMSLTTFTVTGFSPNLFNYKYKPFYLPVTTSTNTESIQKEIIHILTDTFKFFDADALQYFIVMYILFYYKLFEEIPKGVINNRIIIQFVDRSLIRPPPLQKTKKTAKGGGGGGRGKLVKPSKTEDFTMILEKEKSNDAFTFTLNKVEHRFKSWREDFNSKHFFVFSLVEIIQYSAGVVNDDNADQINTSLYSYILSTSSESEIQILQKNHQDNDKEVRVKINIGYLLDNDDEKKNFQISNATKVTKFFYEGFIAFLLYDEEKACSIVFPVGSLQENSKPIDWRNSEIIATTVNYVEFWTEAKKLFIIDELPTTEELFGKIPTDTKAKRIWQSSNELYNKFINLVKTERLLEEFVKLENAKLIQSKINDTTSKDFSNARELVQNLSTDVDKLLLYQGNVITLLDNVNESIKNSLNDNPKLSKMKYLAIRLTNIKETFARWTEQFDNFASVRSQFLDNFLLVRVFDNPWKDHQKIFFKDVAYFYYIPGDNDATTNLCLNTTSFNGGNIMIPEHIMRYLMDPIGYHKSYLSVFARDIKNLLSNKDSNFTNRDIYKFFSVLLGNLPKESFSEANATISLIEKTHNNKHISLLKQIDVYSTTLETIEIVKPLPVHKHKIVAVLSKYTIDDKRNVIRLFSLNFVDQKTPVYKVLNTSFHQFIELTDEKFNDIIIVDFDIVFIHQQLNDDFHSLFYLQFTVYSSDDKKKEKFYFTHGLYYLNVVNIEGESLKLQDVSESIEKLKFKFSAFRIYQDVFNKGFICLYEKPITISKPRIFDYIFYKFYKDDRTGLLVFFSYNENQTSLIIREMRITEDDHKRLDSVYPVIDNKDEIRVLFKFLDGGSKIEKLERDEQSLDETFFKFASKLRL